MESLDPDLAALLSLLQQRSPASSGELQAWLRKSQPTISRLLQAAASHVLTLGAGRRTRYALPLGIGGRGAQQPLQWVHEDGSIERLGTLSFLFGGHVHIEGAGLSFTQRGRLPWFLAPLRAEGFLGRKLARELAAIGLPDDPYRWNIEQQLIGALHTPDAPGAIVIGEPRRSELPVLDHDLQADEIARSRPAGSSAGGEQAKFLARRDDGTAVLVKFSPPRGTPFGERWNDLLQAEALALELLGEHGVPVAQTRIVTTSRRTYLESTRFDRIGLEGRRHVVPLHAVHEDFVAGSTSNWAASCEALVQQGRLPREAAPQVHALLRFGRLIGNNDMHFGNLSLVVTREGLARGRFTLAPLYDMLPMRWRPDPLQGEALGPLPFEPEPVDLQSPARPLAQRFWERLAEHKAVSRAMRQLAQTMARRVADCGE